MLSIVFHLIQRKSGHADTTKKQKQFTVAMFLLYITWARTTIINQHADNVESVINHNTIRINGFKKKINWLWAYWDRNPEKDQWNHM